ncbi:BMP family ABC transporter substrate-binding protein [Sinorhizobium medicae]|uniref:BMP family ABC transporter substrate-binding protein n=1 Tax=Sinorhizobium medicae TaxID=110321 RepID=A0A6G1WKQ7_9HYPH|nr:BMP family protein [Sinorhizobium medicae]MDX0585990.1 BMP family ABC transporter substrate-binding protein [Sinorhizobium medicae]MDX0679316.1 BMP family ABC transporter substrate-binding protein [Sinorhizobium medicae]MQV96595.1 BMP family ABC transporter substrate-binding protein [Sinorhizobium medicae]MQW70227.1 BMP family ABC transporter substrate-binding protein [Sinorhizobium medicae]MQX82370.1 BMP family ABC transporter substrate-binding protein [Sinorhizobium medicae]
MTRNLMMSRRNVLASGLALGVSAFAPAVRAAPIKVAGIHASPVENAWNSVLHKALQDAAAGGAIEYVFSEGVSGTDYPRAMREYAEQGVRLIIGEAYAVEKQARDVAADYPETAFVLGSSGKEAGENFGVFGTWNHDGAYLAGMLAGKMTKSNVVGSVGAIPIPEVNMLINAFAAGVKAVNPEAKHLVAFIGTFFDPPKAREAGLAQIDAGADILFGERIGTADAAKERGLKSVGSLIDYTPRYPETVFANALWGFRPILDAAIADVSAGNPVGKDYTAFGLLKEGGSDIAYVKGVAPADAEAAMEAKRAEIKSGAFEVPRITDEPK